MSDNFKIKTIIFFFDMGEKMHAKVFMNTAEGWKQSGNPIGYSPSWEAALKSTGEYKLLQGATVVGWFVEAMFISDAGEMFFLRRDIHYRGGFLHCVASWSPSGVPSTFEELHNAPHFEDEEQFFNGVFALNREKILSSLRMPRRVSARVPDEAKG